MSPIWIVLLWLYIDDRKNPQILWVVIPEIPLKNQIFSLDHPSWSFGQDAVQLENDFFS